MESEFAATGETDNVIELDCGKKRAAWFELPPRDIAPEDWERYRGYVAEIFGALGMELDSPGTRNTPERYLRALFDATAGYDGEPKLLTAFPAEGNGARTATSQILEGPIAFQSLCEHHALPFHGFAHIGYVAGDQILGISKLTRLVRLFARRFTVQERLGEQIADALVDLVSPRGVEEHSRTITTFWRGAFDEEPELRREFLHEVRHGRH